MDLDDDIDDDGELPEDASVSWLRRTGYHPPSSDAVIAAHQRARTTVGTCGLHLLELVPATHERARMLDALDEALMWANAAIARHHPDNVAAEDGS